MDIRAEVPPWTHPPHTFIISAVAPNIFAAVINVWGGWVQEGTSWAPYLRPDIHFADTPCDVLFAKTCFGHMLQHGNCLLNELSHQPPC